MQVCLLFEQSFQSRPRAGLFPSIFIALPVFSSDAISSVAYATQGIVLVMGAAGLAYHGAYTHYTLLISGLIVALLVIVVTSYWQTIFAIPAYIFVTRCYLVTVPP